jgi:hypothetical protein
LLSEYLLEHRQHREYRNAISKHDSKPELDGSTSYLAKDNKLVAILRGAIDASIRDDGWAAMAAAGSAAKRQAPSAN